MGLFALAVAPGIAICLFIYFKDKYNRESRKLLIWSFILGVLSVIPAIIIQLAVKTPEISFSGNVADTAINAFLVIALSEELSKFLLSFHLKRSGKSRSYQGYILKLII